MEVLDQNNALRFRSWADIHGEWEDRKISVVGVVKSFISQLRVGIDLTRVSMPSVYLRPYSLLEEGISRNSLYHHLLLEVPKKETPLERLLALLAFFVASTKQENYNHKPINPTLGETSHAYYRFTNPDSSESSTTYFLTEQVSHHPPISAARIDNPTHNLSVTGHYSFQVHFHGSSVSVCNTGNITVSAGEDTFIFKKPLPDILIKNIWEIIGKHQVVWDGDLTIESSSGYWLKISFDTHGNENFHTGYIYEPDNEDPILAFKGTCGGKTYYWDASLLRKKERKEKRTLLIDATKLEPHIPCYLKRAKQEPNSSANVWALVAKHVVENEMDEADKEKKKVEDRQRQFIAELEQAGKPFEPQYFIYDQDEEKWKIKDATWWKEYKKQVDEEEQEISQQMAKNAQVGQKKKRKKKK